MSAPPRARHAIILGAMTALSAFGVDMYLPAFAPIARDLNTDTGHVQYSLVAFFLALACGQALYGPVSDMVGRRPPLVFGFLLYSAAALACSFVDDIWWLVALRFLQGIGACAGIVIARAVVRDLHSGLHAARMFALMMLTLGTAPILAPMLGSLLLIVAHWHSIFWFQAALGAALLLTTLVMLEETNPRERRMRARLGPALRTYAALLRDRLFMVPVLAGGCAHGAFFAYLAGSSFVFIELHGVPTGWYSFLFAANAIAMIGAAQFNVRLVQRFGANHLMRGAAAVFLLCAVLLLGAVLLRVDSVPLIVGVLLVMIGSFGLINPTAAMLALESHGKVAGTASALMGSLQFACGAISSAAISALFDGTAVPMTATMVVCAALTLVFAWNAAPAATTTAEPTLIDPATDAALP